MRPQLLPAIAVGVATTLSLFNASPPALADIVTITYTGTISPWLWNGRDYYQGTLIDTTGIFGGGGLTGDPFTTTWTVVTDRIDSTSAVVGGSMYGGSAPILEAVLTINGYSVDFAANYYLYGIVRSEAVQLYSNVTVRIGTADPMSLNSFIESNHAAFPADPFEDTSYTFDPLTDNLYTPHQLGGGFRLSGLNGYLDVDSVTMQTIAQVPGPIVGAGLPGLLLAALGWLGWRRRARQQ